MTSEQLKSTRAERWRQVGNPVLTADDARAWLDGIGLCLFVSRRAHFPALAPSFVEAVAGAPTEAPSRESIQNATALLRQLAAEGSVVPLNLFGTADVGSSDQPDFLATRTALPYIFSLIGGRNWKSSPGMKATPLMTEVWTLLNEKGARTAAEIQTELGREVTEAAVLRALVELWHGLRVIPVYDGETTKWELTQARFAAEMTASQKAAHTTALSALVSLYLESMVAASSEEIETFLSPLASRSRVREVVNGLSATRQLGLISVGAQPLFHVAGSLPEFADEETPRSSDGDLKAPVPRSSNRSLSGPPPRRAFERGARPERGGERAGARSERPNRERDRGREGGERSPLEKKPFDKSARPFGKKPFDKLAKPFGKKPFDTSAKPFGARPFDRERTRPSSGTGGKFPPGKFGGGKERPWQNRGEGRSAERPASGSERPFRSRREDEHGGEERRSGKKFSGGKFGGRSGFGQRADARGPRREGAERGLGRERPGEKRRFFRDRDREGGGERRQREPHAGNAGSQRREGGWKPKSPGGGFAKRGKPGFQRTGERGGKPAGDGERREFPRAGKPEFKRGAGFGKSGRPFGKSAKPGGGYGKSPGKPAKPFGKSGRPAFGKPKPGFGAKKPGGFKPPFRKRKDRESESGE